MREESHTKGKRKKKEHTTHSRLTSQHHPATPADTDPHPIILFSTHLRAPVLIISATAHTLNYTLLPTPCPHTTRRHCTTMLLPPPAYTLHATVHMPCLGLADALPQPVFRSLTVATSPLAWLPLLACTATIRLLSAYCSHVCLHYCARLLLSWVQPLCSPLTVLLAFCVSSRLPALPPVPYASPLSLSAAYTTLTAR